MVKIDSNKKKTSKKPVKNSKTKKTSSKVVKSTSKKTNKKIITKTKKNKEKRKLIIKLLIPTIFLFLLVVGATYAYYNVQSGNNSSTHRLLTSVDSAGSVSLVNNAKHLHIRMTALNMKQNNGIHELWATNTNENYDEEEIPREIAKATVIGGEDTTRYTCTFTLNIDINGDMADYLEAGDGLIKFSGLANFEYDLTDVEGSRTITINNLSGKNREEVLYVSAKINNKNSSQDYLQGRNLEIEITNSNFSCTIKTAPSDQVYAVNFYPNRLPIAYQEVDYIENSGSQYIDTGVTPSKNLKTDITWTDTSAAGSNYVLGARAGSGTTILYSISGAVATLSINTTFNGSAKNILTPRVLNEKYNLILDIEENNNQYRTHTIMRDLTNGSEYEEYGSYTSDLSGTLPSIMVFAMRAGQVHRGMRLHSLKMWENNVLIRDFVPCYRISDGKPGLYDMVDGEFYTNESESGQDFTYGPETYYDQLISVDEETNLTKNTYTKNKYNFVGWNTEPDGSGDNFYDEEEVYNLEEEDEIVNLYAQWSNKILVLFDPDGGTVSIPNKTVSYNESYGDLPTPTKEGYTFKGWTRLSAGYSELNYIESTGTQYATTNIIPDDTTGVFIKLRNSNVSNDKIYFGSGNTSNNRYWIGTTSGHFYYGWNSYVANSNATAKANTVYDVRLNYNNDRKFKVGNSEYTAISETLAAKTKPITIFGYMNGSSNNLNPTARIYHMEVTKGTNLVADYIPCYRTDDGKAGFCDIVGGGFYPNLNTSGNDFTKGSNVYINSSTIVTNEENHTLTAVWEKKSFVITIAKGYGLDTMTYDGTTADSMTRTLKYGDTIDLSTASVTYLSDFSGKSYAIKRGAGSISGSTFTVGNGTATVVIDPAYPKKCYCNGGSATAGTTCNIGVYTYAYKRKATAASWSSITDNGWGIKITDKNSTAPITEAACAYINDKPLVNTMNAFYGSKATSIDLSNWYTKNVTQTTYMFRYVEATELIGVGNMDMTSVTNAGGTFAEMPNIQVIDLTNWDTSHITNFNVMFRGSSSLTTIYAGPSFVTNLSGQGGTNMFDACSNLVGGQGTHYDSSFVGISRAKIDGGQGNEGYFTLGPPPTS